MKKRLLRFFLGILYMGLMAALLILYVQNITGNLERMFAVVGTLVLATPAVVILILYIRLKNREEEARKEAARKENAQKEFASKGTAGSSSAGELLLPPVSETSSVEIKPPEMKSLKIEQMEDLEARLRSFLLSKREMEVAWLLYRGYTNRQIAEELYIAETTVKKHATHIYEKIQVSGRKEFKEKLRNIQ